jgi:iron complex outermembrane recepter protein
MSHDLAALPGLRLSLHASRDSDRTVLPGIDNLANRRAWRESPYQLGHAYLFPMAPRTAWLTLEVRL